MAIQTGKPGSEMDVDSAPTTVADLRPGHHLCCLYDSEDDYRALTASYLRQGLAQGEKVIFILDTQSADAILSYLRSDDSERRLYLASGQLRLVSASSIYGRGGAFDPEAMISLLRSEAEQALKEGYTALRVAGEMAWALRGLRGPERLIEYEAKVNAFFPGSKCIGLCLYDRRCFPARALLNILHTHPIAAVGTRVFDNFYYVPPQDFLGDDATGALLRNCLRNLAVRKGFEIEIQDLREQLKEAIQERTTEQGRAREALEAEIAKRRQLEERLRRLAKDH